MSRHTEITASEYAATLPYSWYSDPRLYDQELAGVFKPSWQFIGILDDLRDPGSTITASVAGVPILVVRADDGVVRGFVNVCRHRGHVLATTRGTYARFRCPYHGWTYGLDGGLLEVPGSESPPCPGPRDANLHDVRIDQWGPLLFANLSAAGPTLAEHLGDVRRVVVDAGLALGTLRWHTRQEWLVEANWKFYAESTFDCDPGGCVSFPYIWPNLQLHVSRSALVVSSWRPVSPTQTSAELDYFFSEGTPTEERSATIERYSEMLAANIAAVESVQRGAGSNQLEHGLLMTEGEKDIKRFHDLLRSALAPSRDVHDAVAGNGAQA